MLDMKTIPPFAVFKMIMFKIELTFSNKAS